MSIGNDISRSSEGPNDSCPYVPSWCYDDGPKMCQCGHHEGFHNDAGECNQRHLCGCSGMKEIEKRSSAGKPPDLRSFRVGLQPGGKGGNPAETPHTP